MKIGRQEQARAVFRAGAMLTAGGMRADYLCRHVGCNQIAITHRRIDGGRIALCGICAKATDRKGKA